MNNVSITSSKYPKYPARPNIMERTTGRVHQQRESVAIPEHIPGYPQRIMIVFDWDDTIFPTHHIFEKYGRVPRRNRMDTRDLKVFQELDEVIVQTLAHARNIGKVFIVTDAPKTWVEDTSRTLLPNVYRYLFRRKNGISIMSTSDMYTQSLCTTPQTCKDMAFDEIIARGESGQRSSRRLKLINIGHSQYEQTSASSDYMNREQVVIKNVLVKPEPTIESLLLELTKLNNRLLEIASFKRSTTFHYDGRRLKKERVSDVFKSEDV